MSRLQLVGYGRDATRALAESITEIQQGDRLAPVTVVTSSPIAGLSLRRELAADDRAGGAGLANVRFLGLSRLAELLGAARLAAQGRTPASPALRAEALRTALRKRPGPLGHVAEHPSTQRAVGRALDELKILPAADRAGLRRHGERVQHLLALLADVAARLSACYDEHDLARSAAAAVDAGAPALRDVGHVVLFLPTQLSEAQLALSDALARKRALSALIGLTGDPEADGPARQLAARLPLRSAKEPADLPEPPIGDEIRTVADAEEEAREAVRLVVARLEAGVPARRLAVLSPPGREYAALVHEQLSAAGIPFSGPAPRTLAQSAAGAALTGILDLAHSDLPRNAVMRWLTAAPILEAPDGAAAPASRWDLLSRKAGVVRGPSQWRQRLERHAAACQRERDELEAAGALSEGRSRHLTGDIEHARRLLQFVDSLAAATRPGSRATWAQLSAWSRELLRRYLGDEDQRAQWPQREAEAARAVEQGLEGLAGLDAVGAGADLQAFRQAVDRMLDAPAGRIGRFGQGVFAGRVADAAGCQFDTVIILGMAEGLLPSRMREDPLLAERVRSSASSLRQRAQRLADERRDYLAALAAARERVLLFSRADERAGRQRLPSRWLLETASRKAGRTVFSEDLVRLQRTGWHAPALSYEWSVRERAPVTARDWMLRALLRWPRGAPLEHHPIVAGAPALRAGLAAHAERRRGGLTARNGLLGPAPGLALGPEIPVSPSALEAYASCPLSYFLGRVLRVAETQAPSEEDSITALERGSLVHAILARFVDEVALSRAPAAPGQPWSAEDRERLRAIAEEEMGEREARGVTGKKLIWRLQRERILADLDEFLDRDTELRRSLGVAPAAAELAFGDLDAPVLFEPAGAPPLALRGRIDRLDRAPDGSRLAVIDYKTGRHAPYAKALGEDPVGRGQLLQLPVYALAARARHGDVPVSARYWFSTGDGDFRVEGYDVDSDLLARFGEAVGTIAEGIRAGRFPARPGPSATSSRPNCTYCPYDPVCPTDREGIWQRTRPDPALARYVALAEPEGAS